MTDAPAGIDPDTFFLRPDAFPLEFGPGRLDLVPMTRDSYGRSLFTDRGRVVAASRHGWQAGLGSIIAEFERRQVPQPSLTFIFHIAHCGSTLLSRAMDVPQRTLVIREPFVLRQLGAEAARTTAPPGAVWRQCLGLAAALLGRRYAEDQPVIVKANVPVNFIIDELMKLNPDSGGVLLYAPLERYLLSVLKTPMHARWIDNVTGQLAIGLAEVLGAQAPDLSALTTAERAGCLWLAQMRLFRAALSRHDRLRSLDCEVLFERPSDVVGAAMDLAGAPLAPPEIDEIVNGELFRRHAKDPARRYDADARRGEMRALAERLAPDVERACRLVREIDADDPVVIPPPAPLCNPACRGK
jgi:hypothetical protein